MVHATDAAREALHDDEALVFDWHRVAICCAAAGEVSLRRDSPRAASPSPARSGGSTATRRCTRTGWRIRISSTGT